MAARDYLWASAYEGPGYFGFAIAPPLALFPHTVEGSVVDIGDDQFGDASDTNVQYRLVNVSNGHRMLYYGGATFGWNGAPPYHEPRGAGDARGNVDTLDHDPQLEVRS